MSGRLPEEQGAQAGGNDRGAAAGLQGGGGGDVYLGHCPSFSIDPNRCCLSLNIAPGLIGLFFLITACGCPSNNWGLLYLLCGPVMFGLILVVMTNDEVTVDIVPKLLRPALAKGEGAPLSWTISLGAHL